MRQKKANVARPRKTPFEILAKNYGLTSPYQVQEKIIFKLLESIVIAVWNIQSEQEQSKANEMLTSLRSQWRLCEKEQIESIRKLPALKRLK